MVGGMERRGVEGGEGSAERLVGGGGEGGGRQFHFKHWNASDN